jgi:hypothetical protein
MNDTNKSSDLLLAKSLNSSVREINKLHGEILDAAKMSLTKAIKIGEILTGIKNKIEHGQWLPWIQNNFAFTDRTARNYMRCFDARDRLKLENVSDLSDAYTLLTQAKLESSPADDESAPVPESAFGNFIRARNIALDFDDADDMIVLATASIVYRAGGLPTGSDILSFLFRLNPARYGTA